MNSFSQHIKMYSCFGTKSFNSGTVYRYEEGVAEECCQYTEMYSNVKRLLKDLNQNITATYTDLS